MPSPTRADGEHARPVPQIWFAMTTAPTDAAPWFAGRVLRGRRTTARRPLGLSSSRTRFAARAAHVRRRPWLVTAWLAGGLALLAGGIWLVQFSPILVARSVRVEGVPRGAVAEIMRRAAVPIGTPMVRVDTTAIADRVI